MFSSRVSCRRSTHRTHTKPLIPTASTSPHYSDSDRYRGRKSPSTDRRRLDDDRPSPSRRWGSPPSPSTNPKNPKPKPQDTSLPIVRIGPATTSTFFSIDKFDALGLHPKVLQSLASIGISRPSHVQSAASKALISLPSSLSLPSVTAKHVVIADHAGSGKTLAYLLPFISALKEEEDLLGSAATQPNCPRLIVVAPTTELCAQVVRVCRALSRGGAPFRSIAATGGYPLKTHKDALSDGVDVLVATPGRLRMLMEAGVLHFHHCRGIVFDEVDILLGEASAFAEQVLPVCKAANPDTTKLVFVSATLPENIFVDLEMEFPGLQSAIGPGLHRNPPNIIEQLVDCSGGDEVTEESGRRRKMAALYAVLQEQKAPRTIVFCNKIETCRTVENFLNRTFPRESNTMVLPHHAAISDQRREQNLATFLQPPPPSSSGDRFQRQPTNNNQDSSPNMILVCTDRASRGVDSAYVTHVVLFDFPRDPSEYVRRVGRTARGAGGEGLVSVLVLGRQVSLAQAIISKNLKGQPIHKVPISLGTGTGTGGGGGGGGVGGNIGGNNNNNSGNSVSTAQGQTMSDDAVRFWKDIKELGGGKDGEEEEEEEDDDDRDSGDYNGRE